MFGTEAEKQHVDHINFKTGLDDPIPVSTCIMIVDA